MSSVPPRLLACVVMSAAFVAGCTTEPISKPASPPSAIGESSTQPARATYNCADGGMITVENFGSSVRVSGASEEPLDLPAAPANQRSRYGAQPYALVLEGNDALFMKNGAEPLTCTR